jgi:serine/threonine protein kinase/tetratricopeptide (TPR) repeat protein
MTEREIFIGALQRGEPAERQGYLDEACRGNEALLRSVQLLLEVHERAGSFLAAPEQNPVATVDKPVTEHPGTVIGSYKLLEQIGEGGFGVVFMAEQQKPVRRKVALKVLKPGMDTRQVVARFEAERQALALMDHPNIAHVFDGGETGAGRPYFVMELVRGVPITDFCDQSQLPVRERLRLFLDVCQAVQHAHQKGVIHRDIKPSNVLITRHDATPVVKVIDFGIAKAAGQHLTDKTLFTNFAQMIGTPLYMSPEQAGLSDLDVDTRSDIYSLGVLLYELLTATTPFEKERFQQAGYDEMRRIIREEEPPRPSTRISTLGQASTTISTKRQSDPRRLSQLCRGELDWIVMKALEKDRNRRYESASAFAADVQRYLQDEPVLACPPSAWYRFRKFARRNKGAFVIATAAALVTLLVVIGLAVSNVLINQEKNEKVAALQQARINEDAADEQRQQAEDNLLLARQAVDELYTQVANELQQQPHMQRYQREVLQKALRFYQEFAKRKSGDATIRLGTALALLRVANIQQVLGQHRQAMQAVDDVIPALEALAPELPNSAQRRQSLGQAYMLRGSILNKAGYRQQAVRSYRQALALYGELVAEHPEAPGYRSNVAASHQAVGALLADRPRDVEKALCEANRLCKELVADQPAATGYGAQLIGSYLALGRFLSGVGRSEEAESAVRHALDLINTSAESLERTGWRGLRPEAHFELAQILAGAGRWEAAEKAYRPAVVAQEKLADRFPDLPGYRASLAGYSARLVACLTQLGKTEEAALLRRSVRDQYLMHKVEFLDERELHSFLANASGMLVVAGDLEAAEDFLRNATTLGDKLTAKDAAEPGDRLAAAENHAHLGAILQERRRAREAAAEFRQALAIYDQLTADFPEESTYRYRQAGGLNSLGRALRKLRGELDASLRCHDQALALAAKLVADFPEQPHYRTELVRSNFGRGITLRLAERLAEAVKAFQQALDASHPPSGVPQSTVAWGQVASVHNEWAWLLATGPDTKFRDPARAVELAKRAVELAPQQGSFWNTLGAAHYAAGNCKEAIAALQKSMDLCRGGDSFDWFFVAMARWKLGDKEEAMKWHQRAVEWMDKHKASDTELRQFRAEASLMLGVPDQKK